MILLWNSADSFVIFFNGTSPDQSGFQSLKSFGCSQSRLGSNLEQLQSTRYLEQILLLNFTLRISLISRDLFTLLWVLRWCYSAIYRLQIKNSQPIFSWAIIPTWFCHDFNLFIIVKEFFLDHWLLGLEDSKQNISWLKGEKHKTFLADLARLALQRASYLFGAFTWSHTWRHKDESFLLLFGV